MLPWRTKGEKEQKKRTEERGRERKERVVTYGNGFVICFPDEEREREKEKVASHSREGGEECGEKMWTEERKKEGRKLINK